MSADLALVDTNVLVAALYKDDEHHGEAKALIDAAQDGRAALCLTSQVLAEFYSVVTGPRVLNPLTAAEARGEVLKYLSVPTIVMLPAPVDVARRWVDLAASRPVTRGRVFDLQLVATMLANGVSRIYTLNRKDFEVFEGVQVLDP
jgi:toxin-antitoxin system PIN domain toxin